MNSTRKTTRNVTHAIRNDAGQFATQVATPATLRNQELVNQNLDHWDWLEAHGYSEVQPNELFATPARNVNWNSR